jgi:hypothetical protein
MVAERKAGSIIAPDPKTDEEERKERDKDDAWAVPTDLWDFYLKIRTTCGS